MPKRLTKQDIILAQNRKAKNKKTRVGSLTKGGPSTTNNPYNAFNHFKPVCDVNSNFIITLPLQTLHSTILRKMNSQNYGNIQDLIDKTSSSVTDDLRSRITTEMSNKVKSYNKTHNVAKDINTLRSTATSSTEINVINDELNIVPEFNQSLNLSDVLGLIYNPSAQFQTCPGGLFKEDDKLGIYLGTISKPVIIPVKAKDAYHANTLYGMYLNTIRNISDPNYLGRLRTIVNLIAWRGSMASNSIVFDSVGHIASILMNKVYHEHTFITTSLIKLTKDATGYKLGDIELYSNSWLNLLASVSIFDGTEINGPIGTYDDAKVKPAIGFDTEDSINKGNIQNMSEDIGELKDIETTSINSFNLLSIQYIMNLPSPSIKFQTPNNHISEIVANGIKYKQFIEPLLKTPTTTEHLYGYQWLFPTVYTAGFDPDGSAIYNVSDVKSSQSLMNKLKIMYYEHPPILTCAVYDETTNDTTDITTITQDLYGIGVLEESSIYREEQVIISSNGFLPVPDQLNDLDNGDLTNASIMFDFLALSALSDIPANIGKQSLTKDWIHTNSCFKNVGTETASIITKSGENDSEQFTQYEYAKFSIVPREIKFGSFIHYDAVGEGVYNIKIKEDTVKSSNLSEQGIVKDRLISETSTGMTSNSKIIPDEGDLTLLDVGLSLIGPEPNTSEKVDDSSTSTAPTVADTLKEQTIHLYKMLCNSSVTDEEYSLKPSYLIESDAEHVLSYSNTEFINTIMGAGYDVDDIKTQSSKTNIKSIYDAFVKVCFSIFPIYELVSEIATNTTTHTFEDETQFIYMDINPNNSPTYGYQFKAVNVDIFQAFLPAQERTFSSALDWLSEYDTGAKTLIPVTLLFKDINGKYITARPDDMHNLFKYIKEVYNLETDNIYALMNLDITYMLYRYASTQPNYLNTHYHTMRHLLDTIVQISNVLISTEMDGGSGSSAKTDRLKQLGEIIKVDDIATNSYTPKYMLSGSAVDIEEELIYISLSDFYTLEQVSGDLIKPMYPIVLGEKEFPTDEELKDIKGKNFILPDEVDTNVLLAALRSGDLLKNYFPRIGYRFWGDNIADIIEEPTYRRLLLGGTHDVTNTGSLTTDGNINLINSINVNAYANSETSRGILITDNPNANLMGQGYIKPDVEYTSNHDNAEYEINGKYAFDMELSHLSIRPIVATDYSFTGDVSATHVIEADVNELDFAWKGWAPNNFSDKHLTEDTLIFSDTALVTGTLATKVLYSDKLTGAFLSKINTHSKIISNLSNRIYKSTNLTVNSIVNPLVLTGTLQEQLVNGLAAGTLLPLNSINGSDLIFSGKSEAFTYTGMAAYPKRYMSEDKYLNYLNGTEAINPLDDNYIFSTGESGWSPNNILDGFNPISFLVNNTNVALSKRRAVASGVMAMESLINTDTNGDLEYYRIAGEPVNKLAGLYRKKINIAMPPTKEGISGESNRDTYIYTYIPDIDDANNITGNADITNSTSPFKFTGFGGMFSAFGVEINTKGTNYVDVYASFKIEYSSPSNIRIDINNRYTIARVETYSRLIDRMQSIIYDYLTSPNEVAEPLLLSYTLENIMFWGDNHDWLDDDNINTNLQTFIKTKDLAHININDTLPNYSGVLGGSWDQLSELKHITSLTTKRDIILDNVFIGKDILKHLKTIYKINFGGGNRSSYDWLLNLINASFKSTNEPGNAIVQLKISIISIYTLKILIEIVEYSVNVLKINTPKHVTFSNALYKLYNEIIIMFNDTSDIASASDKDFVVDIIDMFQNIDPMALNSYTCLCPSNISNKTHIILGETSKDVHSHTGDTLRSGVYSPKSYYQNSIDKYTFGSKFVQGFVSSLVRSETSTKIKGKTYKFYNLVPSYFGQSGYDILSEVAPVRNYLDDATTSIEQLDHILIGRKVKEFSRSQKTTNLKQKENTDNTLETFNLLLLASNTNLALSGFNVLDTYRSYLNILYQFRRIRAQHPTDTDTYSNYSSVRSNYSDISSAFETYNAKNMYMVDNEYIERNLKEYLNYIHGVDPANIDSVSLENIIAQDSLWSSLGVVKLDQIFKDQYQDENGNGKLMYYYGSRPRQTLYPIKDLGPMGISPINHLTYNSKDKRSVMHEYYDDCNDTNDVNYLTNHEPNIPYKTLHTLYSLMSMRVFVGTSTPSTDIVFNKISITARSGEGGSNGGTGNAQEYLKAAQEIKRFKDPSNYVSLTEDWAYWHYNPESYVPGYETIMRDKTQEGNTHIGNSKINIVTWNLKNYPSGGAVSHREENDVPPTYKLKNKAITDTINGLVYMPDVICFQEVWDSNSIRNMLKQMGYSTIITSYHIGDFPNLNTDIIANTSHWDGLVIASKFPVKQDKGNNNKMIPRIWRLDTHSKDHTAHFMDGSISESEREDNPPPRNVLAAELILPNDKTLIVYNMHLKSNLGDNDLLLKEIRRVSTQLILSDLSALSLFKLDRGESPVDYINDNVVLCGDFNTVWNTKNSNSTNTKFTGETTLDIIHDFNGGSTFYFPEDELPDDTFITHEETGGILASDLDHIIVSNNLFDTGSNIQTVEPVTFTPTNWSAGVEYTKGWISKHNNILYKCTDEHTSALSDVVNNQLPRGKWYPYYNYWSHNTVAFYYVNDTVQYWKDNVIYKCTTFHDPSDVNSAPDGSATKWTVLADYDIIESSDHKLVLYQGKLKTV